MPLNMPYSNKILEVSSLPGENEPKGLLQSPITVIAHDAKDTIKINLVEKLSEGGEGAAFKTDVPVKPVAGEPKLGWVAKIFKRERLTQACHNKIKMMVEKSFELINDVTAGICFPRALILNDQKEFVGYLMREAGGYELGKSVFQPQLFLKKFPDWNKKDTITLCLTILKKIKYLNDHKVILGDINPANILVKSPKEVYFVDCDSYQIGGYPCPVGTTNFTPPEAQGKDYKTFLRTQEMENFAIATLMFMIMLPGKPPYSAVGGETPAKNIRNGIFPYPLKEDTDKTPPGKWGFIWSQMSYSTQNAFYQTFARDGSHFQATERLTSQDWIDVFKKYFHDVDLMVKSDPMALAIFPTHLRMRTCKQCGNRYIPNRKNYSVLCEQCQSKYYHATSRVDKPQKSKRKPCPICGQVEIPEYFEYCDDCKNKVVELRECKNCLKTFNITAAQKTWEKRNNRFDDQCPTCRDAHCTETPCCHAKAQQQVISSGSQPKKQHVQWKGNTNRSSSINNQHTTLGARSNTAYSAKTSSVNSNKLSINGDNRSKTRIKGKNFEKNIDRITGLSVGGIIALVVLILCCTSEGWGKTWPMDSPFGAFFVGVFMFVMCLWIGYGIGSTFIGERLIKYFKRQHPDWFK